MTKVDQFESVFRAAAKTPFSSAPNDISIRKAFPFAVAHIAVAAVYVLWLL